MDGIEPRFAVIEIVSADTPKRGPHVQAKHEDRAQSGRAVQTIAAAATPEEALRGLRRMVRDLRPAWQGEGLELDAVVLDRVSGRSAVGRGIGLAEALEHAELQLYPEANG